MALCDKKGTGVEPVPSVLCVVASTNERTNLSKACHFLFLTAIAEKESDGNRYIQLRQHREISLSVETEFRPGGELSFLL